MKSDSSTKIVFHIHLEYDENNLSKLSGQVKFYKQFDTKNSRSKNVIYPNKGRMIHYADVPKIVDSILSILK